MYDAYRQLEAVSKSQALILVGAFSYPDTCWRNNTVKYKQPRRFLESTDDNFLPQVVRTPEGMMCCLTSY